MAEVKHNGYYGTAALTGLVGTSLVVQQSAPGFWGAEHIAAVGLLGVAGLLFALTATDNLPGLRDRQAPRFLSDQDVGYKVTRGRDSFQIDITNKRAESAFEASVSRFISSYQYGM